MSLKIDSQFLVRPYTDLPHDEVCPILLETFSSLVQERLSHKRPYILAYVIDTTNNSRFCDAEALNRHFLTGKKTNPATREQAIRIHFFIIKSLSDGCTHFATTTDTFDEKITRLIRCSSLEKTAEVLRARKSIISEHIQAKELIDAKIWLHCTIADFPSDPFAYETLGNLLAQTTPHQSKELLIHAKQIKWNSHLDTLVTTLKKTASVCTHVLSGFCLRFLLPSEIVLALSIGSAVYKVFANPEDTQTDLLHVGSSIAGGGILFTTLPEMSAAQFISQQLSMVIPFMKNDDSEELNIR